MLKSDDKFRQKLANAKDKTERAKIVKDAGFDLSQEDITKLKGMIFDDQMAAPATSWSCWIDGHCGRTCENDVICSNEVVQHVVVTTAEAAADA